MMPRLPRTLRLSAAALALVTLASTRAPAQDFPLLYHRARVTVSPYVGYEVRYVGVVTSLDADTLRLADAGAVRAVPLRAVRRVEVSRGRRGRALTGALVGAGLGIGIGVSTVGRDDAGVGVVVVPLSVALYGGLGALLGSVIRSE